MLKFSKPLELDLDLDLDSSPSPSPSPSPEVWRFLVVIPSFILTVLYGFGGDSEFDLSLPAISSATPYPLRRVVLAGPARERCEPARGVGPDRVVLQQFPARSVGELPFIPGSGRQLDKRKIRARGRHTLRVHTPSA